MDPNPPNWLCVTYNTVEELVRVSRDGTVGPAAMQGYRWADERTLEVELREGECFPDGGPLAAAAAKCRFDEMFRWRTPHLPGTQLNLDPRTTCEVTGERNVRFTCRSRTACAGQAAGDARDEHPVPGRPGLRLRAQRHRRGPMVSDRQTGPVGNRTLHPR